MSHSSFFSPGTCNNGIITLKWLLSVILLLLLAKFEYKKLSSPMSREDNSRVRILDCSFGRPHRFFEEYVTYFSSAYTEKLHVNVNFKNLLYFVFFELLWSIKYNNVDVCIKLTSLKACTTSSAHRLNTLLSWRSITLILWLQMSETTRYLW